MMKFHSAAVFGLAALFGGCAVLPALATPNATGTASLTWDASTSSGVVGYNLYYGTASRVYTSEVLSSAVTNAAVNNLIVGTTYYFAVTAVDSMGLESEYSNEQVFTVTANLPFLQISVATGKITLTGSGLAGTNYSIMASPDLKSWSAIGSVTGTNGSFQFTDSSKHLPPARFYRLKTN